MSSFRFRKRTRLFPGLNLNWSKRGLSSISIGGPGATYNVPVSRGGNVRSTIGVPGTGLSWTEEASSSRSVRDRQQAQRRAPQTTSTEQLIGEVMTTLGGPNGVGDALWRQQLAQVVIDHPDAPRAVREAALKVKSPEMVELLMRRAKGAAATRRAALEVLNAVQVVLDWARDQGIAENAD